MTTSCPICGQEHGPAAACGPTAACGPATASGSAAACGSDGADPFPLHEFAPELAPPARPVLEIVRPRAVPAPPATPPAAPVAGSELPAVADPAELARPMRDRGRSRLPTGIRLVIGRRRKPPAPARRPADAIRTEPAAASDAPVEAPAIPAPPPPAPRSHPTLEAQARLFDVPAEPPAPAPEPSLPISAPVSHADSVGGLLGAFAPVAREPHSPAPAPPPQAPEPTALAPSPRTLPARTDRPVRAERLRVRVDEAPPPRPRPAPKARPQRSGPSLEERWSATSERMATALRGPAAILTVAAATLAAAVIVAPPVAALLVAATAWLVVRREDRAGESPSPVSVRLTASGLAAGTLAAVAALLVRADLGGAPAAWLARPGMLALASAVATLGIATAAAVVLARRHRGVAVASLAMPAACACAGLALAPGPSGLALATGGLGVAAVIASSRGSRLEGLRDPRLAWLAASALAATTAAVLSLLRAPSAWAAAASLLALAPASMISAQRAARSYERSARAIARGLAGGCALATAALIVLMAGTAGSAALALLPLAGLGHAILQRVRERRHHSRLEAPWIPLDGRIVAALGAIAGLTSLAGGADPALPAALLLASCAVTAATDADLVRRPATRLVPVFLAWAAVPFAAAAAGLPWRWIPALAAACLGVLVAASGLSARRGARWAQGLPWTWPALGSAGGCLAAAVVACSAGAWISGGAGVVASALAPVALRLVPRAPRRDESAAPATVPLALSLSLAVLAPAAPLVALGHFRWAGPLFAAEAVVAWTVSRRRPEAQAPLGALLLASVLLLPLLASPAGFVPGALMLAGWLVVGALESVVASRDPARSTRGLACGLSTAAAVALVAWLAAAAGAAAVTLLVLAALLQVADRLASDAVLGRTLRSAATVSWLAGVGTALLLSAAEPLSASLLLAAAALTALIVAALRRDEAPVLAAGMAGAGALAAACLHVGISPYLHPAVYLSPAAAFLVGWGVLQAARHRAFRGALGAGLFLLAGCVVVEAHMLSAPPLLRPVAAALAATMIAGGVLTRHRTPVLAGAAALALEAAWLLGEGTLLVAKHPLPGVTVLAAVAALAAAAFTHLAWRAGGRAPLMLAWTSDLARLRETWSRWS